MHVVPAPLDGVMILEPKVYEDERGFFMELYRADKFKALGLPERFVQENHSCSKRGVVRGLHFQWHPAMGKLMRVTRGQAFLVAVDIRKGSPTLGKWFATEVSAENRKQVWAPPGFARGFCATSEIVELQYACTAVYNPEAESAIRWNDPEIGIQWPLAHCVLSERDRRAQTLAEWIASPHSDHLRYEG